ncbi:MAG: Rossmann-like and DUF2520 domain-containing protein [Bacteroidales bacterium]
MNKEPQKEKIAIIGSGNVAGYMARSLFGSGHIIEIVYSRTLKNAQRLAEQVSAGWTDKIEDIGPDAGVWIFALTDMATVETVRKSGFMKALLLHTAGSLPADIFAGHATDYGVLYPLQTFSGNQDPGFKDIPICIESNTSRGLSRIRIMAESISSSVREVNSEERSWLHAGAVFACNFANHMYSLASDVLARTGIPFEIFHPLILETARKAAEINPQEAQTGPARRNDMIIIKKHMDLLSFSPELKSIYNQLTESIHVRSHIADDGVNKLQNQK